MFIEKQNVKSQGIRGAMKEGEKVKYLGDNREVGDARLELYEFENGGYAINTNGDPIFSESDDGFWDALDNIYCYANGYWIKNIEPFCNWYKD